jgi:hypothetical protein
LHASEVVAVEPPDPETTSAAVSQAPDRNDRRRFLWVAGGITLVSVAVLLVGSLIKTDGHFLYVFDDTAIHQSIVRQLLHHGTWGVASGHYASASSSPGWTLVLAASTAVLPFAKTPLPLLLNLAAALWLIWLVARNQDFLVPRARDRLAVVVLALTAVVLWFLPGLVYVGMEHTLHALLVVAVLIRLQRLEHEPLTLRASAPYLLLLALGTLVRYETSFLAVGCAVALLLATTVRLGNADTLHEWSRAQAARLAAWSLAVSALPIAVFGLVNKSFGEELLPNSVLAKTALQNQHGLAVLRWPRYLLGVLSSDPAVFALVLLALAYVFWAWSGGPRKNVTIAVAFVITALLHAELANFGWFERYQAYLIIAGSFVALRIASEVVPLNRRSAVLALSLLLIPSFSLLRIDLLQHIPSATSNSYRQRYQMALFLHRYYNGRGFLTGELGYTTLLHDGPVVDILGLGTHAAVAERRRHGPVLSASFVRKLVQQNHVEVMAFYGAYPGIEIPSGWVRVGEWKLEERMISVPDPNVEWYAPNERLAVELDRHLTQFNRTLPSRVKALNRRGLLAQQFKSFLEGVIAQERAKRSN